MIYLDLPRGQAHGWGICGDNLTAELSELTDVRSLNELDARYAGLHADGVVSLDAPLLQCIQGKTFAPLSTWVKGKPTVGYCFFEDTVFEPEWIEASKRYDQIAVGSTWMKGVLGGCGVDSTVVLQGVNAELFKPGERQYFHDKFVVFSGGKFEYRKGQDLVIRALRVLMDKHDDVMLMAQWTNHWPHSQATMTKSRYVEYNEGQSIPEVLLKAGIHLDRVILLSPHSQKDMAMYYQQCDMGVFPNRCEGGTNLVLMECMATGMPVIAALNTGHRDVVNSSTSLLVRKYQAVNVSNGNGYLSAVWHDPSLEELIDKLEYAYQHREEMVQFGVNAREHMKQFTWARAAQQFQELLTA